MREDIFKKKAAQGGAAAMNAWMAKTLILAVAVFLLVMAIGEVMAADDFDRCADTASSMREVAERRDSGVSEREIVGSFVIFSVGRGYQSAAIYEAVREIREVYRNLGTASPSQVEQIYLHRCFQRRMREGY